MPPTASQVASNNMAWRRNNNSNNVTPVAFASSQPQHPPYFLGAPITKFLCMVWALGLFWFLRNSSGRSSTNDIHKNNHFGVSSTVNFYFWHSVSSFFFQTSSEAIIGLTFLANYMRRLERELSSRRLIVWLVVVQSFFVLTQLVALATLDSDVVSLFVWESSARGPYHLAGGLLYWYWKYVPQLHPRFLNLSMIGLSLGDKSLGFAWSAYVLWLSGMASVLAGAVGAVGSALFFFLLLTPPLSGDDLVTRQPFLSMDIPDRIAKMLPWDSIGTMLLLDSSPRVFAPFLLMNTRRSNSNDLGIIAAAMGAEGGTGGGGGRPRQPRPRRPVPTAPPAASPEAITQLTAMGFDEQRVKEALQATGNNVELAADRLLTG